MSLQALRRCTISRKPARTLGAAWSNEELEPDASSVAETQENFPIRSTNGLKSPLLCSFPVNVQSLFCTTELHIPSATPLPPAPHPQPLPSPPLLEEVDLPSIAILAVAINARPQKDDTSHYHLTPLRIRTERRLGAACDWLTLSAICGDCSVIRSVYRFHQPFDDGNKPLPTGKLN